MQVRFSTLLLALGVVAAASACDDNAGFTTFENKERTDIVVFAMNGTPLVFPAGIEIRNLTPLRIDPSWSFDLAFDLDAQNRVVVHTVKAVASELLLSLPRVGLQLDTTGFPRVLRAPTSGFVYDSSLTVPFGQTLIIDKIDPQCSRLGGAFLGFNIRAKLTIDSLNLSKRAIYMHMLSNPNCGFRSLQPGEPKD